MKKNLRRVIVAILLLITLMQIPLEAMAYTYYTVNEDFTRLRKNANDKSVVVAKLRKGQKVVASGKTSGAFLQVMTKSRQVGWAYKGYLTKIGSKSSNKKTVKSTTQMYKISNGKGKKAGTISPGTKFTVLRTKKGWTEIKLSNGSIRYIKQSKIK